MPTKIITPPAEMPVTLAEAKLSLKADGDEQDALISAWIEGITAYAEHYTGRAFINRGMRVILDAFPVAESGGEGVIFLDHPPIASVESINYVDLAGADCTLDPQDYVVDADSEPGCVVIGAGRAWPETLDRIKSVTCDYTAGYGPDSSFVPKGIKLFILAKLAEQMDPAVRMEKDTVQSSFIDCLLHPYKVYS